MSRCAPLPAPASSELAALWLNGSRVEARAKAGPLTAPRYLYVLGTIFGGSTALSGVLSSSPRVATLCSSGVHQCEGCMMLGSCHVGHRGPGWHSTLAWPDANQSEPRWGDALKVLHEAWSQERKEDPRRVVLMDKCALDCTPPLRHVHAEPREAPRITIHEIAQHHRQHQESVDVIVMLASCCYSKHPGCNGMNERLRQDHARLTRDGVARVAPLFEYVDLVRRPLFVATLLLDFAPHLEYLDVDMPRLAQAANLLANRTLLAGDSGRHSGLIQYLATHDFLLEG